MTSTTQSFTTSVGSTTGWWNLKHRNSKRKNIETKSFDAKIWLNSASEKFKELTCHEMNQEFLNLTIIEKERCDKQALDFASEGIVCL